IYVLRAVAFPPLRPAALCWAVVPPCFGFPPDPDFLPPRLEAPGEFAIFAARSFDMPLSLRASYCFSFLTFARFDGIARHLLVRSPVGRGSAAVRARHTRALTASMHASGVQALDRWVGSVACGWSAVGVGDDL